MLFKKQYCLTYRIEIHIFVNYDSFQPSNLNKTIFL
jgi:hypothetical protein